MCGVHLTLLWSVMENDHGQESTCLDLCLKLSVSFILLCGAFLSTVIRHHDQGNLRKSLFWAYSCRVLESTAKVRVQSGSSQQQVRQLGAQKSEAERTHWRMMAFVTSESILSNIPPSTRLQPPPNSFHTVTTEDQELKYLRHLQGISSKPRHSSLCIVHSSVCRRGSHKNLTAGAFVTYGVFI